MLGVFIDGVRIDLLSYEDLLTYVDNTPMYDKRHATMLWNTMTAYLPTDQSDIFIGLTSVGELLSAESYTVWYNNAHLPYPELRLYYGVEERRRWKLAVILIEYFEICAQSWTTAEIYNYGLASRALITDWLNSAGGVTEQ